MNPLKDEWYGVQELEQKQYKCGYCGSLTGVNRGYTSMGRINNIYICAGCNRPTLFEVVGYRRDFRGRTTNTANLMQVPPPLLGNDVDALPTDVAYLYDESRKCTAVGSYTGCVLLCRKLLVHIAVEQGASSEKNTRFIQYIDYLVENHIVPSKSKEWVDRIRKQGNTATHEIVIMNEEDAIETLLFVEMLLKITYEFPAKTNSKKSGQQ